VAHQAGSFGAGQRLVCLRLWMELPLLARAIGTRSRAHQTRARRVITTQDVIRSAVKKSDSASSPAWFVLGLAYRHRGRAYSAINMTTALTTIAGVLLALSAPSRPRCRSPTATAIARCGISRLACPGGSVSCTNVALVPDFSDAVAGRLALSGLHGALETRRFVTDSLGAPELEPRVHAWLLEIS